MPYPPHPFPAPVAQRPLIGSLLRFVVVLALWWFANFAIWTTLWTAWGHYGPGGPELADLRELLTWPTCPAVFFAPPAAALAFMVYRLVCRIRRITPRRVFPPSVLSWPAGPLLLAAPIWLYGWVMACPGSY